MRVGRKFLSAVILGLCATAFVIGAAQAVNVFYGEAKKPIDSELKVAVGHEAPDFTLPSILGGKVTLSDFRGRKHVVLSFVPAAFTPVCSEQFPAYNLGREMIEARGAVVIGFTTYNVPSLFAWCREMGGVWFPVVSDFFPHGATAARYGLLRGDGTSERAEIIVDKNGIIRTIMVHEIDKQPDLETLIKELDKLQEN